MVTGDLIVYKIISYGVFVYNLGGLLMRTGNCVPGIWWIGVGMSSPCLQVQIGLTYPQGISQPRDVRLRATFQEARNPPGSSVTAYGRGALDRRVLDRPVHPSYPSICDGRLDFVT